MAVNEIAIWRLAIYLRTDRPQDIRMKLETLAVHAGYHVDSSTGAVTAPVHLSMTFERSVDGSYPGGYFYSRVNNPNREALEQCAAALEGGAAAAAFASGSAAAMSVFQALAPTDHVIASKDVFYGTSDLLRDLFARWGLETTFVDTTDPANVRKALQPNTKLVWVETPSNPLLKITDIAEVAALAHEAGALCACDNTFATPVLQNPFRFGADVIVHASAKYLGGHCDAAGGLVISRKDDSFFAKVRKIQVTGGAVAAALDCWLVRRGIRTLPYRMRGHSENALKIARFLCQHDGVEAVHYPGLAGHPGHAIAARQMTQFGGMLSFQVNGGRESALQAVAKARIFTRASSLGGTESLIEHRASLESRAARTPENLIRLSVGLENGDDLVEDLAQALQ
jgi:cystathionine gamma-synthase